MEITLEFVPDEVLILEGNTVRVWKERSCACSNDMTNEKIIPLNGGFILARQFKACRKK